MVGAADRNNPVIVTVAAYVAKNSVDGHRAAQEFLLDWEEVDTVWASEAVVGVQTHVGLTKKDRKQRGEVKDTPCTNECNGCIELDKDGFFDATELCPAHLLLYSKELWAKTLGVPVADVKGPVWSDMALFEDVPRGWVLVVKDENSPAYKYKADPNMEFEVMTRAEEEVSGRKGKMYFEVEGQPYAVHAWGALSGSNECRDRLCCCYCRC